jgi:hypothetical protein
MPIYRNKKRGSFTFEFDKIINGERVRAVKSLPKSWNQAQADAYDRQESAKLYALATRVERAHYTIDEAVAAYLKERIPRLKSGKNVAEELGRLLPFYQGRPIEALADVCKAYPIIDRSHIATEPHTKGNKKWLAKITHANSIYRAYGPTLLIAAMRAYVASKLGETVEIPDELA